MTGYTENIVGISASRTGAGSFVFGAGLAGYSAVAPVTVYGNPSSSPAGSSPGIYVSLRAAPTANPQASNYVAGYFEITTENGRASIWGLNTIVGAVSGQTATQMQGHEIDITNDTGSNAADPQSVGQMNALWLVANGTNHPSAAIATTSTAAGNRWKHGLWLDGIGGLSGSTLIKAINGIGVSVDYGIDLRLATIGISGLVLPNSVPISFLNAVGARVDLLTLNSSNQAVIAAQLIVTNGIQTFGGGLLVNADPTPTAAYTGIGSTTGLGNAAAANLQAPAKGTGTGPTSLTVTGWVKGSRGTSVVWIPTFE